MLFFVTTRHQICVQFLEPELQNMTECKSPEICYVPFFDKLALFLVKVRRLPNLNAPKHVLEIRSRIFFSQ